MIRVGSANYAFIATTAASCCIAGFTALYAYYCVNGATFRTVLLATSSMALDSDLTEEESCSVSCNKSCNQNYESRAITPSPKNLGGVDGSGTSEATKEDTSASHASKPHQVSGIFQTRPQPRVCRRHGRRSRARNRPISQWIHHTRGSTDDFTQSKALVLLPPTKSESIIRRASEGASRYSFIGWQREQESDFVGALACYRSEMTLHRQIQRLNSNSSKNQMEMAQCHAQMGQMLQLMQCFPRAAAHFQKSLRLRRNIVMLGCSAHPREEQKQCEEQLARSHHDLGNMRMKQGEYRAARGHYHLALKLRKSCLGRDHGDTAESYCKLATVYQAIGDFPRALSLHKKALTIREKTLGRLHAVTAQSYHDVGTVSAALGDCPSALDHHQEALDIRKTVLGDDNIVTAVSYYHLGGVYQAIGHFDTALRRFRKALKIRKRALGDHLLTAESYTAVGLVLQQPGSQQDLAGALVTHQKALCIQLLQPNLNQVDLADTYDNMGLVLHSLGDYGGALERHKEALDAYEAVLGHDAEEVAVTLNHIGSTYHAIGDYDMALQHYQKALQVAVKVLGTDHADTAITYSNIGAALRAQGDFAGALEQHKKALSIKERVLGPNHADTAVSYGQLGMALKDQGLYQESSQLYQRALEIEEVVLGNEHSTSAAVSHHQLGADLAQLGNTRGAWEEYQRSLHILLHQLRERQQSSTAGAIETKNTTRILNHVVREMVDLANTAAGRPPRLEHISSDDESTVNSPRAKPSTELAEFFCGFRSPVLH